MRRLACSRLTNEASPTLKICKDQPSVSFLSQKLIDLYLLTNVSFYNLNLKIPPQEKL